MRIGIARGTKPPPSMPSEEELAIGDETVVLSLIKAQAQLAEAEDRARARILWSAPNDDL